MADTTVKKVSSGQSPKGEIDQVYLASGKRFAMRMWRDEEPTDGKESVSRDYEMVGFVVSGRAELTVEGQSLRLEPGDSWLVRAGAEHMYRITETFTAIGVTSPPAQVHGPNDG